jgi:hypothetical protein
LQLPSQFEVAYLTNKKALFRTSKPKPWENLSQRCDSDAPSFCN